jgi:hypothetical protein
MRQVAFGNKNARGKLLTVLSCQAERLAICCTKRIKRRRKDLDQLYLKGAAKVPSTCTFYCAKPRGKRRVERLRVNKRGNKGLQLLNFVVICLNSTSFFFFSTETCHKETVPVALSDDKYALAALRKSVRTKLNSLCLIYCFPLLLLLPHWLLPPSLIFLLPHPTLYIFSFYIFFRS